MYSFTAKRKTDYDDVPEHITNLQMGSPADSTLAQCADIITTAVKQRMAQSDAYCLFQYGPPIGDGDYREAVARFLTKEYQAPMDIEDIVTTAGATQSLHIISHLLFSPGDIVFVENPTYFSGITILLNDAEFNMKSVSMDDQGLIPEELEKVIEANKDYRPRELTERKPYWGLLYVMANFHNPRGMCLPPDRCRRVIELARKYNLLVVSDDVYGLIYHKKPPTRLFSYDNKSDPDYRGNTVSNGSFSKIFGPGMRLGWMEAPSNLLLSSGLSSSGGGFNHAISGVMASALEMGLVEDLLKKVRPVYQAQCQALCCTLREEMPSLEFTQPGGGFFIWIKLPGGMNGKELLELCMEKYDVSFALGELMSIHGDFKDYIRLAFCHYDVETLRNAAVRVTQAIKSLQSSKK